jgi:BlaI family penicillinase repressor
MSDKPKPPRMGKGQFQIMQALWRQGPCTARQLTDELSRTTPIAHSTVQTLLRQLEAKGAITHEVQDRTFVFRPLYQPDELNETPLRQVLMRVYEGSVVNLMSHLLKHETISREELAQLRELIDEEAQK